jgi:hypothetical protein
MLIIKTPNSNVGGFLVNLVAKKLENDSTRHTAR